MSFSKRVKEELVKVESSGNYALSSELEAFYLHNVLLNGDVAKFRTENILVSRRFLDDIKKYYNTSLSKNISTGKNVFEYEIKDPKIIEDIKKVRSTKLSADTMSPEHKKIYIRTTFLIAGYILDPAKEYHIEFSLTDKDAVELIKDVLSFYDITIKELKRKNLTMLYIKDSEQISNFLSLIGAFDALMEIENIKIVRGVRNSINREVNCETANMNKTITASLKQIDAINKIIETNKFDSLSKELKIVAETRLLNKDLNLAEIADLLGLTKSCVNHRFRKIIEISEKIKQSGGNNI